MESSAIFSIANLYGLRAGATFVAVPTVVGDRHRLERERRLAHVGIEAIRTLIHWDGERKKKGLPPSTIAIPGHMNRSRP
jgi:uridine phosphorylase